MDFWSCGQQKMIYFSPSSVVGCCGNMKTGLTPPMGSYGPRGEIDIDELATAKRSHLAAVRRGEILTPVANPLLAAPGPVR